MDSLNIDRYRDRIISYKKVGNQIHIDRMRKNIVDGFYKSPSYFKVAINGQEQDAHIVEGLEGNNFILMRPGEDIRVGDYVEWMDEVHICIGVRNNRVIQTHAEIQKCNEMLVWQDENLVTYSIPCLVQDKTSVYSDGLSKKKYISIGTDQVSVIIQSNEVTNRLPLDKRFIFSNDANNIYKMNRKDNILNKGLTLFVAKKDLYDDIVDRLDLGLANYIDPDVLIQPEIPEVDTSQDGFNDLVIKGSDRITIWDDEMEYSVNSELTVEWSIEPEGILELETNGNKCTLKPISTSRIGKTVLQVKTVVGEDEPGFDVAEKEVGLFYQ